jgi:hypothetical protein
VLKAAKEEKEVKKLDKERAKQDDMKKLQN